MAPLIRGKNGTTIMPIHRQTYQAYQDYLTEHGLPPSMQDLCDILGLASKSTVLCRLEILRDHGYECITRGQIKHYRRRIPSDVWLVAHQINNVISRKPPVQRDRFLKCITTLLKQFEKKEY